MLKEHEGHTYTLRFVGLVMVCLCLAAFHRLCGRAHDNCQEKPGRTDKDERRHLS